MNTSSTVDTFRDKLLALLSKTTFHYVYVSLGSKINEETVEFNYPTSNLQLRSNAEFQMVPAFLREQPDTNNILSIIIDDFHDTRLTDTNHTFLRKMIQAHPNITYLIVDNNILLSTLKKYLSILLTILFQFKISPTRFMFTNFICFKHPNQLQLNFETKLPEAIQKSFNTINNGYYNTCYYQWFNYAYYTYNYIYCYKEYYIQRLMSIQQLHNLMKACLKNDNLNSINCELITNYTRCKPKSIIRKWDSFLNNCINFVEL